MRLLGISVSGLRPRGDRQLSLDDLFERSRVETIVSARPQLRPPRPDARHDAEQTIHAIRDRFGAASIGPATLVSTSEGGYLDVLRPNMRPWGPDRVPPGKDSGESAENGEQLPLPRGHTH